MSTPMTAPPPTAREEVFDQAAHEAEIVSAIQQRFRTFGGGNDPQAKHNPIAAAMNDSPAQFALGVDVAQVVRFVLTAHHALLGTK